MTDTFFSVIIPTLNEEAYLPELLKDLSVQTHKNFEVIIVDGHSDDATQRFAKKFIKQLPKLTIINSLKRNLPYQRNLGAKKAKGKYLVFLDADVAAPTNYLEKIHSALIKHQVDFLTTWIDADEKSIRNNMLTTTTNLLIEASKLIDKPFACGGNVIISVKAFKQVKGFKEELKLLEDYDLSVRLNKAGYKLFVIRKPRIILSARRLRHQGMRKTLGKYALYTTYFFIKGAPTTDIFKYEMGGHVYNKQAKQ